MVEVGPGLFFGKLVGKRANVPDEMPARDVAEPFDAVSKERDRIGKGEALDGPAVISRHHLVEARSLLAAADEEMAPQLWDSEHETRLSDEPRLRVSVIH